MRLFTGTHKAALILLISVTTAWAQSGPARNEPITVQIFSLKNASQQNIENEILTTLRNILTPSTKMTLVPSQNAIVIGGAPDQIELARKLLNDLDKPPRAYRITYTLIDMEGAKRIGEQHYTMVAVPNQRTQMKQGSRVPIMVNDAKSPTGAAIVTYLDVGMNFDITLDQVENGLTLRTKVERSSIAEERSGIGPGDPIVRQSLVEGTSVLALGKPLVVGSFDIPDSTRHLDVQVSVEPLPPEIAKKGCQALNVHN